MNKYDSLWSGCSANVDILRLQVEHIQLNLAAWLLKPEVCRALEACPASFSVLLYPLASAGGVDPPLGIIDSQCMETE